MEASRLLSGIVSFEIDERTESVEAAGALVRVVAILDQSQYSIKEFRIALYEQVRR